MADPKVERLEQRVATLEGQLRQQLRGSIGTSTGNAGALNIRTMQLGFPAQLTSSYDSDTGYDWKRLKLTPPDFVNPGVQLTGDKSFDISGSRTLRSGTKVWMEPSPDGVGFIFTVSSTSPDPAASDSCASLLGLIRSGVCFNFTIGPGLGSCACVALQTTRMTWDADAQAMIGADLIYGCPPGVATTLCPDGAPRKWVITASGFTSDCTVLNGTWTFTYDSGETWTATKSGISATLVFSGSITCDITFIDVDGLGHDVSYSNNDVSDCCSSFLVDRNVADLCDDSPISMTVNPATQCGVGVGYTPVLDICNDTCGRPEPRLRFTPALGSGSLPITFSNSGCGKDSGNAFGEFSTSNTTFCTDDPDLDCGDNYVVARVTCTDCFDRKVVVVPCGPCCSETSITRYTMPEELCITIALTAGPDCDDLFNDVTRVLTIYLAPDPDPMTTGFTGYNSVTGYVELSGGSISGNLCGSAEESPPNVTQYPIVLTFAGGVSPTGFTIEFEADTWVLHFGANTFTPTVDHDLQTLTYDTTGFEAFFGASSILVTIGAYPIYVYRYYNWLVNFDPLYIQVEVSPQTILNKCLVRITAVALTGDPTPDCDIVIDGTTVGYYRALATQNVTDGVCNFSSGDSIALTDIHNGSCGSCNDASFPSARHSMTLAMNTDDCVNDPPPPTWNCLTNGTCIDPGDGTGEYPTLDACQIACAGTVTTWDCDAGTCTQIPDSSGEFQTEQECIDSPCAPTDDCCSGAEGQTGTLTIVGGPDAGTYSGTWHVSGAITNAKWSPSGSIYEAECSPATGNVWKMTRTVGGVVVASGFATSHACIADVPTLTFPASIGPSGTTGITTS